MMIRLIQRIGLPAFSALFSVVIIATSSVALVAMLERWLTGGVESVDLLVGGLTGLIIGPLVIYRMGSLTTRVERLRTNLDRANERLLSEARVLRGTSAELEQANARLHFAEGVARIAYLSIDPASQTITGLSNASWLTELVGELHAAEHWHGLLHPNDVAELERQIARCMESGQDIAMDLGLNCRDGDEPWMQLRAQRLINPLSGSPGIAGVLQDISARKDTERQLLESEQRHRELVDTNPIVQIVVNAEGSIEFINAQAEKCLGYGRQELIGQPVEVLVPASARPHHVQLRETFVREPTIRSMAAGRELEALRRDGSVMPAEIRLVPFKSSERNLILVTLFDLTERKQAESLRLSNEALRVTNLSLAEANRVKDEFVATMSHELRTPLTGVLNLAEALQEEVYGPLTEGQQRSVAMIESSGRHLLRLINDILDLAKIRAGKANLELETVRINDAGRNAVTCVQPVATQKDIHIEFQPAAQDPRAELDPLRFKQILINRLGNAVKFTEHGGRVGLEIAIDDAARIVACSVWDKGIGIASEDIDLLFKPFVQIDGKLARGYGGTGLGLSLVERLVALQGGSVQVSSQLGQGSRFVVELPLSPVTDASEHSAATAAIVPSFSGGRILLADDDEINVTIFRDFLEVQGFEVLIARNGREALGNTFDERPDLILMDVQIPELDGLEAVRRIRGSDDPALAGTPIIALTALAMPGDEQRCLTAGCDAYLSKPVPLQQLIQTINEQRARRLPAEAISAASGVATPTDAGSP
ncbi:MAG: PAS domain S-box protein [Methylotetracoccus sp.]